MLFGIFPNDYFCVSNSNKAWKIALLYFNTRFFNYTCLKTSLKLVFILEFHGRDMPKIPQNSGSWLGRFKWIHFLLFLLPITKLFLILAIFKAFKRTKLHISQMGLFLSRKSRTRKETRSSTKKNVNRAWKGNFKVKLKLKWWSHKFTGSSTLKFN